MVCRCWPRHGLSPAHTPDSILDTISRLSPALSSQHLDTSGYTNATSHTTLEQQYNDDSLLNSLVISSSPLITDHRCSTIQFIVPDYQEQLRTPFSIIICIQQKLFTIPTIVRQFIDTLSCEWETHSPTGLLKSKLGCLLSVSVFLVLRTNKNTELDVSLVLSQSGSVVPEFFRSFCCSSGLIYLG